MAPTVLHGHAHRLRTRSCERGGLHPDYLPLVDANLGGTASDSAFFFWSWIPALIPRAQETVTLVPFAV